MLDCSSATPSTPSVSDLSKADFVTVLAELVICCGKRERHVRGHVPLANQVPRMLA